MVLVTGESVMAKPQNSQTDREGLEILAAQSFQRQALSRALELTTAIHYNIGPSNV